MRRIVSFSVIVLLALIALRNSVYAEEAVSSPTVTATPAILPDNDLRSPRSTIATFMAAMDPSDGQIEIARAMKTLDTSEMSELVRNERAQEIAVKLYAILAYKDFNAQKAPTATSEDAIQLLELSGHRIHVERNGPNWYFGKTTVAEVPDIFREVEPKLSKREMRELADASNAWLTVRMYVPERLKGTTFLIEDWQWLAAIVAIVLLLAIQRLIIRLCGWLISRFFATRLGVVPIVNLRSLKRPVGVVLFTIALQLFLLTIDLPIDAHTTAVEWIATVRIIALVVLGIYLVELFGERLSERASRTASTIDDILYPLVQKASWLLVVIIGIAQVLSVHGVNVSGLVAGLGLGGLAFALAAKDTVENIFGSVAILIDQPFRVGDTINVGSVTGTVEQIGLRSTRLRTAENSLISMPNSKVIAGHVDNLGVRPYLRSKITMNLSYDTPPATIEGLCQGIRELLRSHPLCKRDSIAVFLNEFNPTGLGVLVQFHLFLKDWTSEQATKEQIYLAILRLVHKMGISLTTPPHEIRVARSATREHPTSDAASGHDPLHTARSIPVGWKRLSDNLK